MTFPQIYFLQAELGKILKLENGVKDDEQSIKHLQTQAIEQIVAKIQFVTKLTQIPMDAIYEPEKFIKSCNIPPIVYQERLKEWDNMEKERLSKTDKFGHPIK